MEKTTGQIKIENFIIRLLKFFIRHHKPVQNFMLHNTDSKRVLWCFIFKDCALLVEYVQWVTNIEVIFHPSLQCEERLPDFWNDADFLIFYKDASCVANFTNEKKVKHFHL